jgi:hypothetical protein
MDDPNDTQTAPPRCTVSGEMPTNPNDAPTPSDETRPDGQKVDHWVMCPGEIIKAGFKRPVRTSYQHVGPTGPDFPLADLTEEQKLRIGDAGYVKFEKYPAGHRGSAIGRYWTQEKLDAVDNGCGTVTSMPMSIAETYAANPSYYGSTFCCGCRKYLPVAEFVWDGTTDRVGS